jgi:exopolysaccharide biosynthesis polyprenyl glycosylphosphotransferase
MSVDPRRRRAAPEHVHPPHERGLRRRLRPFVPREERDEPPVVFERPAPPESRWRDLVFRAWLVAADVCAAGLAVGVAHVVFGARGPGAAALTLLVIVPVVFTAMGLYRRDELVLSTNTLDEAPTVLQAATLSVLLAYLAESALVRVPLGAKFTGLTLLALTGATMLLRVWAREAARRMTPPERCLVVGGPDIAERLESKLDSGPAVKAELVGRLDLEGERMVDELPQRVADHDAHRVVIAGEGAPPERVHQAIQAAKSLGVKVSVLPRMFEVVGTSVAFDYIGGLTVLGVQRFGLDRRQRLMKRAFDVAGSLALLVVLSPLLAAIALAIRLDSRGPALFRQARVGHEGNIFEVLKFRSMVPDAEERKAALANRNEADGLFKIDADPRVTRVGRQLRRTSLDELPQLFNVLKGEMSLVGPRPLIVEEDRQIEGFYRRRLHLTPGMTGPWQVLGSARIPLHEMVSIDYLYVANWSLWGDVKILLRTVPSVLLRRGQ